MNNKPTIEQAHANADAAIADAEKALKPKEKPQPKPQNIYTALALFQSKVQKINLDGEVKTNKYTFKYATLGNIIDKIKPAMNEAGLAFTQLMEGDKLRTIIACEVDGSTIQSVMPLSVTGDPKNVGSLITYYRRYALVAALGLAADDDKDAPEKQERVPLPDTLFAKALARIGEGEEGVLDQVLQHFEVTATQVRAMVKAEGNELSS